MAAKSVSVKKNTTISYKPAESVLDRFRLQHAANDKKVLVALFHIHNSAYSQQPAFVLSDGINSVKVTINAAGAESGDLPQFHIAGGQCVAIEPMENGGWELEIIPGKGTVRTVITSLTSSVMAEYPLLVAPPLELFDSAKADKYLADYVGMVNELAAGDAGKR